MSTFDDGSAAHEPVSPTFHDFGVRVPPGADYVTESGQRFVNWSDREMLFYDAPPKVGDDPQHGAAYDRLLDLAAKQAACIAALERDNADLATLLAAERGQVAALLSSVSRETPFATHAEAELVERAMPANTLKHSR